MKTKQKSLLMLFLGLFIIPEILWSPVANYVYELSQVGGKIHSLRGNFLTAASNYSFIWYGLIVLIQLVGLVGVLILIVRFNKEYFSNKLQYVLCLLIVFILLALTASTFYLINFVGVSFP